MNFTNTGNSQILTHFRMPMSFEGKIRSFFICSQKVGQNQQHTDDKNYA